MEREIKIWGGRTTLRYTVTEEKKQQLWDMMIEWCREHNASCGESCQNDDFIIDAPEFMADAIDKIIQFKYSDEEEE